MSLDTATTCATVQRSRRLKPRAKRVHKRDLTSQTVAANFKPPEIHVEDDLGLGLLDVGDIPDDMLFPGEYNVYLQDRLKSAAEEIKQLTLLVKEREAELVSLKEKNFKIDFDQKSSSTQQTPYAPGAESIRYADMAACRVMELTKQVCELSAKLEDQKSRCSLAETKLLTFAECQEGQQPVPTEVLAKKEAEMKAMSDKLHATNGKLFECRNRVQQLQQELKQTHKILSLEVGDGVSISELIASGGNSSNWRGRAQQIQVLQQRVIDLSERLRKYCDYRNLESSMNSSGDGKYLLKERKASLEAAQQETRFLQQQLNEHIRKLDASKARIRVLESEINSFRGRVEILTDKGARDSELIHMLQSQVVQLEGHLQLSKEEARSDMRKSERYYHQLQEDLRMEKQRSMQLLSNLEEKEKQIKRLENMLFDLKDKEINALKKEAQCTAELHDSGETSSSPVAAIQECKESKCSVFSECEYKKLLELLDTANRRLNDARHECDKHKSALRMEKKKVSRLEVKLARQEMERIGTFSMSKRQIAFNAKKVAALAPPEVCDMSKEELYDRFEILQEEVLTLKTRLTSLEQEKEDDLRSFSTILGACHQPPLK